MIDFKSLTGRKSEPEPHVTIKGQETNPNNFPDQSVTLEEWEQTRGNTAGFRQMYPKLDNRALLVTVRHHLDNCSTRDDCTYDGTVINVMAPILVKRLAEYTLSPKSVCCFQCGKALNDYNVGRRDDGKIRYDAFGRVWCKKCTDEFDGIDWDKVKEAK